MSIAFAVPGDRVIHPTTAVVTRAIKIQVLLPSRPSLLTQPALSSQHYHRGRERNVTEEVVPLWQQQVTTLPAQVDDPVTIPIRPQQRHPQHLGL